MTRATSDVRENERRSRRYRDLRAAQPPLRPFPSMSTNPSHRSRISLQLQLTTDHYSLIQRHFLSLFNNQKEPKKIGKKQQRLFNALGSAAALIVLIVLVDLNLSYPTLSALPGSQPGKIPPYCTIRLTTTFYSRQSCGAIFLISTLCFLPFCYTDDRYPSAPWGGIGEWYFSFECRDLLRLQGRVPTPWWHCVVLMYDLRCFWALGQLKGSHIHLISSHFDNRAIEYL